MLDFVRGVITVDDNEHWARLHQVPQWMNGYGRLRLTKRVAVIVYDGCVKAFVCARGKKPNMDSLIAEIENAANRHGSDPIGPQIYSSPSSPSDVVPSEYSCMISSDAWVRSEARRIGGYAGHADHVRLTC